MFVLRFTHKYVFSSEELAVSVSAPGMPALLFIKGQMLDPAASNSIGQLFQQ